MTGYTFSQLIDFTRTSAATFVNSSGNIASTPQSVNLLTHTQEFDNAAWTKANATITANSTTAPDGTSTADTMTASGANGTVLQTFTASAVPYTFSIWLRRLTGTGNVQLTVDGTTFVTVAVTSDWTRFSTTLTPSAGSRTAGVRIVTSGDAVYGWGAQLELGSTASTYTRNFGGLFPARFDYDPLTLAPRGLLVEEQRTNLLTYSEQFDNASWTKINVTVTAGTALAPDGTMTAETVTASAGAGAAYHYVYQAASVSAGATYSFSIYVKAGTTRYISFGDSGDSVWHSAYLDTVTGQIVSQTNCTATATGAGNGWFRVTATFTRTNGGNTQIYVGGSDVTGSPAPYFAATGSETCIAWGAQLEAGSFATSYIPTVASQVTRSADQAVIQAQNFASWYNQSEGTFVVDGSTVSNSSQVIVTARINTNTIDVALIRCGAGAPSFRVQTSAGVQADFGTIAANGKTAAAYRVNDFAVSSNGGAVSTDTSGSIPTVNILEIGSFGGGNYLNGHIRSIRYYPTRLSNAQLQALSA